MYVKQQLQKAIQLILLPALFLLMLAGCSDPSVSSTYPLESVVNKDAGQTSRIYRAENQTVPEVAHQLADQRQPDEISKDDNSHMFLVYSDEWYHIQQDANKPSDTLIEVDSKEFVQQNYDHSFLEGYITATIINSLFDSFRGYGSGHYRGYTTRDTYKPVTDYHTPSAKETKQAPPITKNGTGSITKRGTNKKSSGSDYSSTPSSGSTGKITRSSGDGSSIDQNSSNNYKSPTFSPRSKSPPRTKSGSGRVTRRR